MPVIMLAKNPGTGGFESHLGWGDYVFCFFSSVSYNLEGPGKWGSRFPRLLLDLCDHGVVEYEHLDELDKEIGTVYRELQRFPSSVAVYDIADPTIPIPWEVIPSEEKNSLMRCWVARRGTSYFKVFADVISFARYHKTPILLIATSEENNKETLWDRKKKGRNYWKTLDSDRSIPKKVGEDDQSIKKVSHLSADFNVFFNDLQAVRSTGITEYCKSIGFAVEVCPDIIFTEHSGFLPFKLSGNFMDETAPVREYLTGFEMYIHPAVYSFSESRLKGLFQKTASYKDSFKLLVKEKTTKIVMHCSTRDSFEPLMAHIFGAYLCKHNNGVFYDPQTGLNYTDPFALEREIKQLVESLRIDYKNGNLSVHEFNGWV